MTITHYTPNYLPVNLDMKKAVYDPYYSPDIKKDSIILDSVNDYDVRDDSFSLKKVIKAYQDEKLTGLTDEERDEIERRSKEYLEKRPIKSKQDFMVFNNYVKSLMKKFGFKGDIDDFAASTSIGIYDKLENSNEQSEQTDIIQHFYKSAAGALGVKNKVMMAQIFIDLQ